MRKTTLLQKLALGALVVVAIGAIGYVANRAGGESDSFGLTAPMGAHDLDEGPMGARGGMPGAAPPPFSTNSMDGDAAVRGETSASAPDMGPMPGGTLASAFDRKIVHSASMQLRVEEVGASFEEVGRIATSAGGFIASSSFSYQGERQIASVTIRVPTERYQRVLGDLRALGVRVESENSEASDVTEEYTDLASRLRNLEATESQLLMLLNRAETITDIMTVQDRLNQVRYEIEHVKGRIQMLDNMSDLATITVHLRPDDDRDARLVSTGTGVDLGVEVREAWDASLRFLGGVAAGVIMVVVFAWWVPIVALPLVALLRLTTRNRQQAIEAVD